MMKKTAADLGATEISWDSHMASVFHWQGKLHIAAHGRMWYIYIYCMFIAQ